MGYQALEDTRARPSGKRRTHVTGLCRLPVFLRDGILRLSL
jgi:hypothetical protein